MISKRLLSILVLFAVLSFPASASVVSFLLVETGLGNGNMETQYTSLWEGGLMNAFFDAGHIVNNSPIARMERIPARDFTGTVEADFKDAVSGGAEFFILGFIDYQVQAGKPVPTGIILKIYKTKSQEVVYEQRFQAGTGKSLNEEYQIAQSTGRIVVSHLKDR